MFMAQAKLPDINAALVTHRQVALMAYSQHDFRKCQISIMAMIALLPKEYQVIIDDEEYKKQTDKENTLKCPECDQTTLFADVTIMAIRQTKSDYILTGKKESDYWNCPKCNQLVNADDSELDAKVFEKPYYFKALPEPPIKKNIFDRYTYTKAWREWLQQALAEIEHQIALCRTEYEPDDENYESEADEDIGDEDES